MREAANRAAALVGLALTFMAVGTQPAVSDDVPSDWVEQMWIGPPLKDSRIHSALRVAGDYWNADIAGIAVRPIEDDPSVIGLAQPGHPEIWLNRYWLPPLRVDPAWRCDTLIIGLGQLLGRDLDTIKRIPEHPLATFTVPRVCVEYERGETRRLLRKLRRR